MKLCIKFIIENVDENSVNGGELPRIFGQGIAFY